MAFDLDIESEDFFQALKPLIPKALEITHLCFEQVLIKQQKIKAGEYDKGKGSQSIFVASLKINDERYGFNFECKAFSSTPTINELEKKISEIQALLLSLGVYNPHPFPDEELKARIVIEHMPFLSGVFSISLDTKRYNDGKYHGHLSVTYEDIVMNFEEAVRLVKNAAKRNPIYYTALIGHDEPDREFVKRS